MVILQLFLLLIKSLGITISFENSDKKTDSKKNKIRLFSNLGFIAEIADSEINYIQ